MSKLVKPYFPYAMVPNSLLNSSKISLKAKGLFAFMQSKPDGWKFSVEKIAGQCKEAKSSVSEGLKELEKFGFLERKKQQTSAGFTVDYYLHFKVIVKKPITDFQSLETQPLESQSMETQLLENPIIGKSVNNSNKELSNKEISNKEKRESSLGFLEINFPSEFERLMMQFKNQIKDWNYFLAKYEAAFESWDLPFEMKIISGKFSGYALTWVRNQKKYDNVDKIDEGENKVYAKLKIS